jgi:hypothetical protein
MPTALDLPSLEGDLPSPLEALQASLGYRGQWAPLYLEPIPGSGERITFAVAILNQDGKPHIERLLRPDVLRLMYGPKARHLAAMFDMAEHNVAEALTAGRPVEPVLQGFFLGNFRVGLGQSQADLVEQGRVMSASLATRGPGEIAASDAEEDEKQTGIWAQKVQQIVTTTASDLAPNFYREWRPVGRHLPARFGYFDGHYAAHFGVVRRDRPTGSIYHLKSRLWELASCNAPDLAGRVENRDLLLFRPNPRSSSLGKAERKAIDQVIDQITSDADQHDIFVLHTHDVSKAANHLYKKARRAS